MKRKPLAVVSLTLLILTTLWIVLLIADMASAGPLDTFEQVLAHSAKLSGLFYATYTNATLLTLCAVAWMALLYRECQSTAPAWCAAGVAFVPLYGALNLCVYLSQITVVPHLLTLRYAPAYQEAAMLWLRMTLQLWPASAVATFNSTAYAVLGIPSIIFGMLLGRRKGALRVGGILLALNGVACIVGLLGTVANIALLQLGVMVGGGLFLAALFPLTWVWFKLEADEATLF